MKIIAYIRQHLTISILLSLIILGITGLTIYYNHPKRLDGIVWEWECGAYLPLIAFSPDPDVSINPETDLVYYLEWPTIYRENHRKIGWIILRLGDYMLIYISDNPHMENNNGVALYWKTKKYKNLHDYE